MDKKLSAILKKVEKPSRYVGGELCMPVIDDNVRVRYCLCVPEVYEDAFKNIEAQVIYHMLNDRKGYSCERCYAPYLDMAKELKKEKYPLYSLETKTPLAKFDVVNFSFEYELSYTTFLYMLNLAGIPLESKKRGDEFPFIYGSGICMCNPEPLAEFLDFAVVGDVEDVTIRIVDCITRAKASKMSKEETLKQIAQIEGVYVPQNVNINYNIKGVINNIKGNVVKRQIVRDLDRVYFPTKLLLSNVETKYDCGVIEIMKGASSSARYYQKGFLSRPIRERRVQSLVSQATAQILNSGENRIRLSSLTIGDYSKIQELNKLLLPLCENKNVNLGLPKFNIASVKSDLVGLEDENTLAFTIEAGSQRLRNIINKDISVEDINNAFQVAFESGYNNINLYFMIGLPYENSQDLLSIVDIVLSAREIYKGIHKSIKGLKINVCISSFIPKPFTPFQWSAFVGVEELKKRQMFLSFAFNKLAIDYKFYSAESSEIEALLSRGDRRLCAVLKDAFYNCAVFDKNPKYFNAKAYFDALNKNNVNAKWYLDKKELTDILPWALIDAGISVDYLKKEYELAKSGVVTKDCKKGCSNCGLVKWGMCNYGRN